MELPIPRDKRGVRATSCASTCTCASRTHTQSVSNHCNSTASSCTSMHLWPTQGKGTVVLLHGAEIEIVEGADICSRSILHMSSTAIADEATTCGFKSERWHLRGDAASSISLKSCVCRRQADCRLLCTRTAQGPLR